VTAVSLGEDRGETAASGVLLFEQGRYEEAAAAFEKNLTDGSTTLRERALLALSYAHTDRLDAALKVADHARREAPSNSLVQLAYANVLYMDEQYEAATDAFSRVRRLEPSSEPALDGLVASLLKQSAAQLHAGELAAAEANIERVLSIAPSHPAALGLFVTLRKRQGRNEGIIDALEQLARQNSRAADVHAELARRYMETGRIEDAIRAYREAEAAGTDDPTTYLVLARHELPRATKSITLSRLHLAIGKGVQQAGALRVRLARRLDGNEQDWTEDDITAIEDIVRRSEEPISVIEDALALLERVHGDAAAFERDVRRLSEWYPSSRRLKIAIGRLLERNGSWEDAHRHWSAVLEAHPTLSAAQIGTARALDQLGMAAEARLAYRRALDRAPEHEHIYDALSRLYEGDESTLRQFYLDRLAINSRNPTLLEALAQLERHMGMADAAAGHRAARSRILEERRSDSSAASQAGDR
jgi:tetratricopeptide (TPR) repeat protein